MALPKEIVGETIPATIGPLDTELTIQTFEAEWTTVSYKQNVVHVTASAGGSSRGGGVIGTVQFTVGQNEWRQMNNQDRDHRDK